MTRLSTWKWRLMTADQGLSSTHPCSSVTCRNRTGIQMAILAASMMFGVSHVCGDVVNLADGGRLEGSVSGVTTGEVVVSVGRDVRRLPVTNVTSVELGTAPTNALMVQAGRQVVICEDGTRLGIVNPVIGDGRLKGRTVLGDVSIPLQAVGCLLRPNSHEKPMDVESLAAGLGMKRGDQDVLVVSAAGGQPVTVSGILLRMGGGQVVIEYDGTESPLPGDSVRLVQMAKGAGTTNLPTSGATLICSDGSTLIVDSISVEGNGWLIRSAALGAMKAPRDAVSGIRLRGEQVVLLSDITPVVRQTGFFDESFPWKKNKAVSCGPLQINGRTYDNGIGVHARCSLTYRLAGVYRTFSALAGIDDSAGAGSALFSIEADGKTLFAAVRVEGGRAPQRVRLDVKGVENMTVVVDFADGTFGSGARVDLCEASLAR